MIWCLRYGMYLYSVREEVCGGCDKFEECYSTNERLHRAVEENKAILSPIIRESARANAKKIEVSVPRGDSRARKHSCELCGRQYGTSEAVFEHIKRETTSAG